MTAPAGDRVLVLVRLRRAEAGLVEQLATIRAAIAELEAQQDEAATAPPVSGLLTVEETARALRASRSRVFALLAAGELEGVRVGRSRCVPAASVERFLARAGAA